MRITELMLRDRVTFPKLPAQAQLFEAETKGHQGGWRMTATNLGVRVSKGTTCRLIPWGMIKYAETPDELVKDSK